MSTSRMEAVIHSTLDYIPNQWLAETSGLGCNSVPRRSKYPIFNDSGPQNHPLNGFWDQKSPSILSTWNLWVDLYRLS